MALNVPNVHYANSINDYNWRPRNAVYLAQMYDWELNAKALCIAFEHAMSTNTLMTNSQMLAEMLMNNHKHFRDICNFTFWFYQRQFHISHFACPCAHGPEISHGKVGICERPRISREIGEWNGIRTSTDDSQEIESGSEYEVLPL